MKAILLSIAALSMTGITVLGTTHALQNTTLTIPNNMISVSQTSLIATGGPSGNLISISTSGGLPWKINNLTFQKPTAWERITINNATTNTNLDYGLYFTNVRGDRDLWNNLYIEIKANSNNTNGPTIYAGPISQMENQNNIKFLAADSTNYNDSGIYYDNYNRINANTNPNYTYTQFYKGKSKVNLYERIYLRNNMSADEVNTMRGKTVTFDEIVYAEEFSGNTTNTTNTNVNTNTAVTVTQTQ